MSRIIVKGLPSYLTDVRLRDHFCQKGAVTDAKLLRKSDGTSRNFGFVGYRSEQEAQDAVDYFNRTFVDTCRITVELARKIGDGQLQQQHEKIHGNKRKADHVQESIPSKSKKVILDGHATPSTSSHSFKAPKDKGKGVSFEEFMAVMAPKSKRKAWQNEDVLPEQTMDDILSGSVPNKAAIGKDSKEKVKKSKPDSSQDAPDLEQQEVVPDLAVHDEAMSDLEYMRMRMKRRVGVDGEQEAPEKQFGQSEDEQEKDQPESEHEASDVEQEETLLKKQEQDRLVAEQAAKKEQETVDVIMDSGRLFIRNLPFSASEDDIKAFFESFGSVEQVHISLDKQTKASKGLAFVKFIDAAHALAAYRAKDGSTFQGRLLHLIPAVEKNPKPETASSKSLKQTRHEQRKTDASKDFTWSMLYMNSDAVASSIADRLGVSKSDILNPQETRGADNAAVRLALAETRIIQETKEFLVKEGIDVDAFNQKERSETCMLVKNIPYGTTAQEIQDLFSRHGQVDQVLIPPAGTIAIVEMPIVGESRIAFRAIAYKRFKNSIIYLEKAPIGIFNKSKEDDQKQTTESNIKQAPLVGKQIVAAAAKVDFVLGTGIGSETEADPSATLFVKNLNFGTTDDRLGKAFSSLSDFAFARIQTKPDPRKPGGGHRLSMGYGFVGFKSIDSAKNAQKVMEGFLLDGHTLSVNFAKRGHDTTTTTTTTSTTSSNTATTKILVKNLPFEATKRDVQELFGSQGLLKSVRLPKKFDSKTRGFAFVEYASRREAESAFQNLQHSHLLGRHLVLQWSDSPSATGSLITSDEIEKARKKTNQSLVASSSSSSNNTVSVAGKKTKIKLGHEDIVKAAKAERRKNQLVDDDDDDV